MQYSVLYIVSWFAAVAGALSISFPSGTMEALKPLNISWKHDKNADAPFFLEKTKLDEPGGPGQPDSEYVDNSSAAEGTSSIVFDKPGLFEVVAIDAQNHAHLFTTEVAVQSPTSSISTTSTTTIVRVPTSPSVPSPVPSLGIITTSDATEEQAASVAGGIAGGITGLVLLSIAFILWWRLNRSKKAALWIPCPFCSTSSTLPSYSLVPKAISPTEPRAQMPLQGRVKESLRTAVALPRTRKERLAANGVHDNGDDTAVDIDGDTTEVSEPPPTYTSECHA
ncbi:hypothetical protein BDP27DRAFT_1338313 [Rhodocollybia butyracea]|uniref:Uncharacterized protein n=1 Tax=Rhodocollybia butyracea TaxID=206335 RepID=A0A9P5PDC3_9AGAR|nr:hypothetical protein BDP27DRAFT_1338313 [Rhodocollybia butyracea]